MPTIAPLRSLTRTIGAEYVQVLYRLDGKQTWTGFADFATATKVNALVEKFGAARAPWGPTPT